MMKPASKFSAILFAPVLIAFLMTAFFLLPGGVLFTSIAFADPTVPLSSAASYNIWILGPIAAALGLFLAGRGLHSLHRPGGSARLAWTVTWAVFSVALFLAGWVVVTIFASVGASDTPEHIFLRMTALFAAGLTLLAQALVIPWLIVVSRILPRFNATDPAVVRKKALAKDRNGEHG
jgi:hypothetical protein